MMQIHIPRPTTTSLSQRDAFVIKSAMSTTNKSGKVKSFNKNLKITMSIPPVSFICL